MRQLHTLQLGRMRSYARVRLNPVDCVAGGVLGALGALFVIWLLS